VNEGLQEHDLDQPLIEAPREADRLPKFPELTTRAWLRLAYSIEFLIAILAIFTLWGEVGGEGHMDLLPWYFKLIGVLGSAWCCVRFTAGMVEQPAAWNRRTVGWFTAILLFGVMMGGLTYYYHLHEAPDDSDDTTSTVSIVPPSLSYYESDRTRS